MLAGDGAKNFAASMGFKRKLINQKSREDWLNGKKKKNISLL